MERDMGTTRETKAELKPREPRFARVRPELRREMDLLRSDIAMGRQPFRSDLAKEMEMLLRSITLRFGVMLAICVGVTVSVILTAMRLWL